MPYLTVEEQFELAIDDVMSRLRANRAWYPRLIRCILGNAHRINWILDSATDDLDGYTIPSAMEAAVTLVAFEAGFDRARTVVGHEATHICSGSELAAEVLEHVLFPEGATPVDDSDRRKFRTLPWVKTAVGPLRRDAYFAWDPRTGLVWSIDDLRQQGAFAAPIIRL